MEQTITSLAQFIRENELSSEDLNYLTYTCKKCGATLTALKINKIISVKYKLYKKKNATYNQDKYIKLDEPRLIYEECENCKANYRSIKKLKQELHIKIKQNIPPLYHTKTFDNYEIYLDDQIKLKHYYNLVKNKNLDQNLIYIFTGTVGTGKTHLSCATCLSLLSQKIDTFYYIIINNLLTQIRNDFTKELKIIDQLSNYYFLVLDEIGLAPDTAFTYRVLYTIINNRINNNLPTLLISNFTKEYFVNYIQKIDPDGRLYSRIFAAQNILFSFEWEDYRFRNRMKSGSGLHQFLSGLK